MLNANTSAKRLEQARKARQRAIERQRERQADPEWRQKQIDNQAAARERQLARSRDPEVIAAKRAKQLANQERKRQEAATRPAPVKAPAKAPTRKKATSKGMKGRTPTADERRVMNAIGAMPCVCCAKHGRHNPIVSLHHTDGRTKPGAHYYVLPLCQWHHDTPASPAELARYPDLIPYHAKGSLGGKAAFEQQFGPVDTLIAEVWAAAGFALPNEGGFCKP